MSTVSVTQTLQEVLSKADPNRLADALRKVDLGNMLKVHKLTLTNTAVAATIEMPAKGDLSITNGATVTTANAASGGNIMVPVAVRVSDVTGGTGAAGVRFVGDASATPSATVCALSADGSTLTFEGTVKAAVVWYIAMPATLISDLFDSIS